MHRIPRSLALVGLVLALVAGCPARQSRVVSTSSLGSLMVEARESGSGSKLVLRTAGESPTERTAQISDAHVKQVLVARLGGKMRILALTDDPDQAVRMYDSNLNETWRGIPASLRPWKLAAGDVDGDGSTDIGVGVYKKARFHPVMAKRPFIYEWDGKQLRPKWLGSRLSRPFTDFVIADFGPPGAKIVAIELTKDGANELAVYSWHGFGFIRDWAGAGAKALTGLKVSGLAGRQRIAVRAGDAARAYFWNGRELKFVEGSG